jgi:putative ATP-binding cassette transporter
MGALLLLVVIIEIVATVLVPTWRDYFYGGVEAKDMHIFHTGLWYFAGLMLAFVFSQGLKTYAIQKLALEWRTALAEMLTKAWMQRLPSKAAVDNPDQRIAEDTNIASMLALELVVEVIISASIIAGLIFNMDSTLIGLSVGYTIIIAGLAAFFHRPLVDREKALQRAEADYRFKLASIVADGKKRDVDMEYGSVLIHFRRLINTTLGFNLFSRAKNNLMNIVPLLVLVPMYFADEIGFGAIMKGVSQFDLLVINATILIILYPKVTKALASYERIAEFYKEIK